MRIREMLRLRRVQAGRLLNDLGDFLGRRSAFREANALCILQSFQIGPGRVKIAIGRGRTSRPENDIRPVKNITSVARKSQIATLPGVSIACSEAAPPDAAAWVE